MQGKFASIFSIYQEPNVLLCSAQFGTDTDGFSELKTEIDVAAVHHVKKRALS